MSEIVVSKCEEHVALLVGHAFGLDVERELTASLSEFTSGVEHASLESAV